MLNDSSFDVFAIGVFCFGGVSILVWYFIRWKYSICLLYIFIAFQFFVLYFMQLGYIFVNIIKLDFGCFVIHLLVACFFFSIDDLHFPLCFPVCMCVFIGLVAGCVWVLFWSCFAFLSVCFSSFRFGLFCFFVIIAHVVVVSQTHKLMNDWLNLFPVHFKNVVFLQRTHLSYCFFFSHSCQWTKIVFSIKNVLTSIRLWN